MPLYGNLSPAEQRRAILPSRDGERKVVIATPIAETSLTIEGVRTVIDSGLCRMLVFDGRSGLSHLETVTISMDMAKQRMGRAGRLAPGTCYRLWTKAAEHRMADGRKPEIEYADLAPLLLDVAAFGEADAAALPWLTKPPVKSLVEARQLLLSLGNDTPCRISWHNKSRLRHRRFARRERPACAERKRSRHRLAYQSVAACQTVQKPWPMAAYRPGCRSL